MGTSVIALLAIACAATPVVVNVQQSQSATQSTKAQTVAKLESVVNAQTPPTNAKPTTDAPTTVAGKTLPIGNATVYVFTMSVDADEQPDTLYWVTTETATIVWGKLALTCVDDQGKSTGETGEADFVYEHRADGSYGWFTGTGACGYTTKYGCSSDGKAEVCGGCDYDDELIVCVASTSG
jgi:hypothetical protein